IPNPLPQLGHPQWLDKKLRSRHDPFQQQTITNFFFKAKTNSKPSFVKASNNNKKHLGEAFRNEPDIEGNEEEEEEEEKGKTVDVEKQRPLESNDSLLQDSLLPDSLLQDSEPQDNAAVQVDTDKTKINSKRLPVKEIPDISENFDKWLEETKKIWHEQREARKRRGRKRRLDNGNHELAKIKKKKRISSGGSLLRADVSDNDNDDDDDGGDETMDDEDGPNTNDMSRYFQRRLDELYQGIWQIVQVVELSPGKFALWAFTADGQLRQIQLQIKRNFCINFIRKKRIPKFNDNVFIYQTNNTYINIYLYIFQRRFKLGNSLDSRSKLGKSFFLKKIKISV
ncbi:hypothetical protein RFI_35614, partial [Reticulomyxa filosa]